MEYVKLKVRLRDDPKVIGLSDKAFRAYITTLCWSGEHETDGELPAGLLAPRIATELRKAGLLDGMVIHNWGQHQRTHAEMDAKRIAGRKAAASRWGNATPSPEVEVEVRGRGSEQEHEAPNGAIPANRPDHDQTYLAEKLAEAWGQELAPPALQKLNNAYGRSAVSDALRSLHGFPPEEAVRSVYAYVEEICRQAVSA